MICSPSCVLPLGAGDAHNLEITLLSALPFLQALICPFHTHSFLPEHSRESCSIRTHCRSPSVELRDRHNTRSRAGLAQRKTSMLKGKLHGSLIVSVCSTPSPVHGRLTMGLRSVHLGYVHWTIVAGRDLAPHTHECVSLHTRLICARSSLTRVCTVCFLQRWCWWRRRWWQ